MSGRRRLLAWLPPVFIGVSAAVAAEVSLGILLYAGEGLMRSLSTTLVVITLAFAAGLSMRPTPGPDLIDRLRRRWLMCLLAFLAAAFYGTSWSVLREMGGGALSQGGGLALLGALPLYTAGTVLAGLTVVASLDDTDAALSPGVPAAFGAALGFLGTGLLLGRAPMPSSLLIGCLVLLSLGGLLYGVVLGGRLEIEKKATRPWAAGDVRVEDRRISTLKQASRTLFEGEFVRRRTTLEGGAVVPWEVAVARALMPAPESDWRVLLLGGGASDLPRVVLREHPGGRVDVVERVAAVLEVGREFFETDLTAGVQERRAVHIDNFEDAIQKLEGVYQLILVDGAALRALGGSPGLSRQARKKLASHVSPGGSLVWGPDSDGVTERVEGWVAQEFARSVPGGPGANEVTEDVLVMSAHAPYEPLSLPGFDAVGRSEPVP